MPNQLQKGRKWEKSLPSFAFSQVPGKKRKKKRRKKLQANMDTFTIPKVQSPMNDSPLRTNEPDKERKKHRVNPGPGRNRDTKKG